MKSPIFIFSLPRSGSTLLQRVLMSHEDVFSLAEPWIVLPQIYALKKEGSLTSYSQYVAQEGISDFISNLPKKKADYIESLRKFITDLYQKQCPNNEKYFLDKTPRYYLIIDEIVELFPDAKFVFLFRNPIHIYASIINTWGKKRFKNLQSNYIDLVEGTKLLSEGAIRHKDKSHLLNYESFISDPLKELEMLSSYLEIDFTPEILNNFSKQDTKGRLGDPTGTKDYVSISNNSLNKWEETFNSLLRKTFAKSLLKKLHSEDLETQGYQKEEIINSINKLDNQKNIFFIRDCFDYFTSYIIRKWNLNLILNKNFHWRRKKYLS